MLPAAPSTLKRIAVSEVRIGMHLHKLEGDWISHPFWKTRFVIRDPDDLVKLHGSGIDACWIDTALGLDVVPAALMSPAGSAKTVGRAPVRLPVPQGAAAPASAPAPAPAPEPAPAPAPAHATAPAPPPTRSMSEELREAAAICERGRQAVTAMFGEARMGRSIDAESCMPLVEEISASVLRNPGALVSLARLKTRDDYSYMHSVAVCALMVALARRLGHDDARCRVAGAAGLMHDIGKALMPLELLNKPGRLSEAEFEVMRSHPERGHALLLEGGGSGAETLDVVLHHHERWDGRGYPRRLAGEQISLLARMGAVCDVYDAITSNRPYKAGWDPAESIARMAAWKGQFDETVFGAFVHSLGIYPVGSQVQLASGKLAIVIEQNPHKLVAPVVKAFFSTKAQMPLPPQRVDLARTGCSDRIVGRVPRGEGPDAERLQSQLDELWAGSEVLQRSRR